MTPRGGLTGALWYVGLLMTMARRACPFGSLTPTRGYLPSQRHEGVGGSFAHTLKMPKEFLWQNAKLARMSLWGTSNESLGPMGSLIY